jgi:hypothetical protein
VSKVTACGGLAGFNRGGASPAVLKLEGRIAKLRDTVQRYAKDCAPYRHPQLQAIAHKHLSADGAADLSSSESGRHAAGRAEASADGGGPGERRYGAVSG